MTPQERLLTIRELMELSNNLFESGGNTLVAAELLWGAMAHGLIAIAALRGWRCEGHQGFRETGRQLEAEEMRPRWRSDVAAGEQLHRHFYNRHLGHSEIQRNRAATTRGAENLAHLLQQAIVDPDVVH